MIADVVVTLGQSFGLQRVFDRVVGIKDFVYALHRCQTFLDGISGFRQVFCRIDDAVENHHIVDECRSIDDVFPGKDECTSKPKHDGDGYCPQKFTHRMSQGLATIDASGGAKKLLIFVVEAMTHLMLGIEGFHDAQSSESFFDGRH